MENNFQVDLTQPIDNTLPYRELIGLLIYISQSSQDQIYHMQRQYLVDIYTNRPDNFG